MSKYQDINVLSGQNFSTADPELAQVRAQLHQTRRELGRLRGLDPSIRVASCILKLESREQTLITKAEALKSCS